MILIQTNATRSFYIFCNISCPRRSLEASKLYKYLIANGLRPISNPNHADFVFIHTCGGFSLYENYSILTIAKSLRNKSAKVVVTGCLPRINPDTLASFSDMLLVPSDNHEMIDSLIKAKFPYNQHADASIVEGVHNFYQGSLFSRMKRFYNKALANAGINVNFLKSCFTYVKQNLFHSYGFSVFSPKTYKIEIAKGCVGNCSFCAIKLAMPQFKSLSEEEVLERFKIGLRNGYKQFALCAGDIGCYGLDIQTNFPNLLRRMLEIEGDYQIILNDLNARWLVKYYPEFLAIPKTHFAKISTIIVPIQSGSDRILSLMKRYYKMDEVKSCIKDLQQNFPNLRIDTHIMVGFPGETDTDFQESLKLIKEIRFSRITIYAYEDRPNTLASALVDKVPKQIISQRISALSKYTT